jgi:hypothetical protein
MGPLGVNYLSLYCHNEGYEGLILIGFLFLTVYLIYLCTALFTFSESILTLSRSGAYS